MNPQRLDKKIVVFSKSYEASLGIARSLKSGGATNIDLFFVGRNHIIADKSNAFQNRYSYAAREDVVIVQTLLDKYQKEEGEIVLFPGDDYTTSLTDRYRKQLSNKFIFTYVESNENAPITHLMDKQYQTTIAEKFGMPMARSWILSCNDERYIVPDMVIFPCFLKPLVSANGPAKSIIRKIEDRDTLETYLKELVNSGYRFSIIAQEYIEIEEEYNIHGICDGENIFLPLIHRKLETARFNKGVTILGQNMNPTFLGDNIELLKDILRSCKYHGIFNVEMFVSKGIVYLNEINFRIAGTCWGTTMGGANIPSLWVNVLLGNVKEWPNLKLTYDSVFLNDKTAWEDLINGHVKLRKFLHWNWIADFHLIKNKNDKGPWLFFLRMMFRKYLTRRIKVILSFENYKKQ